MRWSEEVILLREEMRRVAAFLAWEADRWMSQQSAWEGTTQEDDEGLTAYALRQAVL
jgi:hypothetical protein